MSYYITRICEVCKSSFRFHACPDNIQRGRGRFCSTECRRKSQPIPLIKRFQRYIGMPTESGCIIWTGHKNNHGYGSIGSESQKGRMLLAHRVSYEIAHGPISDSIMVLHSCDNPSCVNPDHLFLGTQADNIADMVSKGRGPNGTKAWNSKLTDNDILEIRNRYASGGVTQRTLSDEFGISQSRICWIIKRKSWKHI